MEEIGDEKSNVSQDLIEHPLALDNVLNDIVPSTCQYVKQGNTRKRIFYNSRFSSNLPLSYHAIGSNFSTVTLLLLSMREMTNTVEISSVIEKNS